MLVNGSFEEQGETPDRAKGWSRWGNEIRRVTDARLCRHGKCVMEYHGWRLKNTGSSGIWQDINGIIPGALVEFSIYATSDTAGEDRDSSEFIELRIETTMYGEQSTVASRTWPVSAIETDGRWSRLAIQTVAPTDLLRVLVIMNSSSNGKGKGETLKLDEARLDIFEPDGHGRWLGCEDLEP